MSYKNKNSGTSSVSSINLYKECEFNTHLLGFTWRTGGLAFYCLILEWHHSLQSLQVSIDHPKVKYCEEVQL